MTCFDVQPLYDTRQFLPEQRYLDTVEAPFRSWANPNVLEAAVLAVKPQVECEPSAANLETAEVEAFVRLHGLEDTLEESKAELRRAFGSDLTIRYLIDSDPEDGSEVLSVDIMTPTAHVEDADAMLSDFCYDWWYDYEGKGRGLIRFRVVETLGV